MLVNLYRSKTPWAIFSLPVLVALLAIVIFFKEIQAPENIFIWQNEIFEDLYINVWLNYLLTVLFVSINAHQLNNLINRHSFYSKDTFLPGILYVLCLISTNHLHFTPELFAHGFIILGLAHIFKLRRQDDAKGIIFMGSFFLGIAAIFTPLVYGLIVFPWISLGVFRPFVWREWLLVPFGMFIPALYHVGIYYLINDTYKIEFQPMRDGFALPDLNIVWIGLMIWFTLIGLVSIFGLVGIMRAEVVRFKKQSQLVLHLLWLTLAVLSFGVLFWNHYNVIFIIPLSLIIGTHYLHARNQLVVNMAVMVWFIIGVVNLWT